jgi:glutathione S-transferase
MKLLTFVGSPNGRKVEAVIRHLGIDAEIAYLDFFGGDLRTPEYLAINPNGMAPTLVDGDFVLWESNAILQYLADRTGDAALFPRDPRTRADVARWQCWELAHFNKAFGTLAFEAVAKPKLGIGPTNEALVETAKVDLARFAPVLERHLEGREYLVGGGLTIADYSMIKLEPYQQAVPFDWAPYPRITSYLARGRALEHWAKTAASPAQIARKPKAA